MSAEDAYFPVESRVVLCGLVNAPNLNGKVGVVRSSLNSNGRYSVFIKDEKQTVGVKPSNLQYEPRTLNSLSAKELKMVLKAKDVDASVVARISKLQLRSKVSEMVQDESEIPVLLAKAKTPRAESSPVSAASDSTVAASTSTATKPLLTVEEISKVPPEEYLEQIHQLKSMDPDSVRQLSPPFAKLSDKQIRAIADVMEGIVGNPQILKMAIENSNDAEFERLQKTPSEYERILMEYEEVQEEVDTMLKSVGSQVEREEATSQIQDAKFQKQS